MLFGTIAIFLAAVTSAAMETGETPQEIFLSACATGDADAVLACLADPSVDTASNSNEGLVVAARAGHSQVVQLLAPYVAYACIPHLSGSTSVSLLAGYDPKIVASCQSGDLDTLQAHDLSRMTGSQLDILVRQGRHHPGVLQYLLLKQMALLKVPQSVQSCEDVETLIATGRILGIGTGELRQVLVFWHMLTGVSKEFEHLAAIIAGNY